MGVINDYIPLANARALPEEQVFWIRFEEFELMGNWWRFLLTC